MNANILAALFRSTATAALVMGFAASSSAQDIGPTNSPISDEIIVTARQRAESLMDVPVAISALSAQDLQRYAASDLSKIAQMVPQVQIVRSGAGTGGSFTIRGIGSSSGDAGIEQTVSVNIDGIQVSRGRAVLQSFFDIAQVEVLKGPQALFFGKNSPGGVISITTNGPTDEFEGYVKAGYEFEADERFVEGAVGGPITDTLGFRIAARAGKLEGWIVNDAPARANPIEPNFPLPGGNPRQPGGEYYAGRLSVEWQPTDSFDASLKLFGNYSKDNAESIAEVLCNNAVGLPTTLGIPDIYGDCALDGHRSSSNAPTNPEYIDKFKGAPKDGKHYSEFTGYYGSLKLNYSPGNINFTSITGFYDYDVNTWDNYDYTSIGLVQSVNDDSYLSVSQELRAVSDFDGPLNFVVGAYYENIYREQETNGRIAPLGPDPVTGQYETWNRPAKNWGDTYSAYGQLVWDIRENLELAGGVRWTREKKRINMLHTFLHSYMPPGIFLPQGVVVAGDFNDDNWSPEATITWFPTPNTTLYAAYKTGYKSGGFSNPSALSANYADIDQARFGSETAEGGEIGAKGSFLNGRIIMTAAVYRYTFDGLQLSSFNAETTTFTIRNAAQARTTGFELDTNIQATNELQLRAAVGYNKARYQSFPTASCYVGQTPIQGCVAGVQDLSGTPLVRAPDLSLLAGFSYDKPVGSTLAIGLSGDAKFTDDVYTQENQNPLSLQRGYWLLNASARLRNIDDRWELALIGRNLANQRYGVSSADKPLGGAGEITQQPARTREILLQAQFRF